MNNIYLPVDSSENFACYTVIDKDTIRGYYTQPEVNSSSYYIDFYINSHYLEKQGYQTWGQWNTSLPDCLPRESITNDFYYRNDLPDILIIIMFLFIFIILFPYKIICRLFGRWLKV